MKSSRRQFIARASSAAGGLLLLPSAKMVRAAPANERLNLAIFGTMYNAEHFLTASHIYNASIVAFCNPDERKVPGVLKKWEEAAAKLGSSDKPDQRRAAEDYRRKAQRQGVKFYTDVRHMFDDMGESIDAFVLSDYDHFHGVACGAALRAGKPVCSERPLGMNISDARELRALAARTKRPTAYRSPGTGNGGFRRAMELVEDGELGPVKEVHVWFKRSEVDRDTLPQGEQPVPAGLNWDLWLGPLPMRGYHPDWMAYSHWRETCNGGLGVFGMHASIFPFLALKMPALWDRPPGSPPITVTAECSRLNRISFPRWEKIRWDIPARASMEPVTLLWHHGPDFSPGSHALLQEKLRRLGVDSVADADSLLKEAGSIIVGSDGAFVGDDHSVKITPLPKTRFEKTETHRPFRLPSGRGIYGDWMDACRGGKPRILADFDHGGALSELVMLGNIATLFPGETLAYDPAAGRITNKPEANKHLGFKYRDGWTI